MVELKRKEPPPKLRKKRPPLITAPDTDNLHARILAYSEESGYTFGSIVQVAIAEFLDAKGARPVQRSPMVIRPMSQTSVPPSNGSGY